MSRILWDLSNVGQEMLENLEANCRRSNGEMSTRPEGGGRFTAVCISNGAAGGATDSRLLAPRSGTAPDPAAAAAVTGTLVRIAPSEREVDALARVAQSEVGHFGKHGADQLEGGIGAVVDTILNRVAHDRYPETIEGVVDQPKQFSAINATGSWTGLDAARAPILEIVRDHLSRRAAGRPSEIRGATHFLNPFRASPSAMASWGQHVVDNAVAKYGSEAAKDIHFHGFPPAGRLPNAYTIVHGGKEAAFDTAGLAAGGAPRRAELRDGIVAICRAECDFFKNGALKESDDPQFKRVGDYWSLLRLSYDGRTKVKNSETGETFNPAWSSAFIGFVLDRAGAGGDFPASPAHCHYFQRFVDTPHAALYEAVPPQDVVPRPGDILHYGRGSAKRFDFAVARQAYSADGHYPSHSDIVVDVASAGRSVTTIGGNVANSVKEKTVTLDANGRLVPRREDGQAFPWIGVLRLRD